MLLSTRLPRRRRSARGTAITLFDRGNPAPRRSSGTPCGLAGAYVGACLGLALSGPTAAAPTPAEVAEHEYAEVMRLTPNPDNGRRVYLTCAVCHLPEGWGSPDGAYPQIAGQLRTVIIKQLADFRSGNRDNPLMYPFSVPSVLGGPQEIADVAAYVAQLPMTPHNGVGPGTGALTGAVSGDGPSPGRQLYADYCVECHGDQGQGDEVKHIPAIAGQHYLYLLRQFHNIRSGARKNADSEMVKQVQGFTAEQEAAVLDYTSRLRPPAAKLAADGWRNPDFPRYVRDALELDPGHPTRQPNDQPTDQPTSPAGPPLR